MPKSTKKQYVTPNLKEHGAVRELTQSSSGGKPPGNSPPGNSPPGNSPPGNSPPGN